MLITRFTKLLSSIYLGINRMRESISTVSRVEMSLLLILVCSGTSVLAQNYRPGYSNNFTRKKAFRQEIARMDITVEREGEIPLPMSLVPRVQKGDFLRVRMLAEPINGIRPSESQWNWTLVIAYVNPSRNEFDEETVSREIRFKRDGWYREHTFKVPYDSQPIFFLYPKPKYRKKIKKLIGKHFNEITKIGEKTLEIAGAYAQIGIFLNQLQGVINQQSYRGYPSLSYGGGTQFGNDFMQQQLIERLAQSFNIALPTCWNNRRSGFYASNDFITRARCVAQNVRLEDFDLSVNRILQQGGLIAATKLVERYPQLAYWINIAAAAADIILKILKKTPLKIVPTMIQSRGNNQYNRGSSYRARRTQTQFAIPPQQKISVYAEQSPTEGGFVTAFPIVLHKWQESPDPDVISIRTPRLLEPCLHVGPNILRNTDIAYDWLRDPFAREFRVIMSAENGFEREFLLTKNIGISGWMLNLTQQDMAAFPNTRMNLEARLVATRGFNRIESKRFPVPISGGGKWEIAKESQNEFSVGGKRRVVIRNTMGSCRCLQSVKYVPSTGGVFSFTTKSSNNPLRFNTDDTEASFEIDTEYFTPGKGKILLQAYGSQRQQTIPITLFPEAPKITKLTAHKGDKMVIIEGERIEQIKSLIINGKTARLNKPKYRSRQPQNQSIFVFLSPRRKILANKISLEMKLDGNRHFKYPDAFSVLRARPTISANRQNEIDGIAVNSAIDGKVGRFDLSEYPVIPVETNELSVTAKTTLTDYSFKTENLQIETRLENGRGQHSSIPEPTFEVLDSLTLQINFVFDKRSQRYLAGRRLQFRIKDSERGSSHWYTIKQTFIRVPQIERVLCQKAECKLSGTGLKYIGQISFDEGKTWQSLPAILRTPTGKSIAKLPVVKNVKLIYIKLRDFPDTRGFPLP